MSTHKKIKVVGTYLNNNKINDDNKKDFSEMPSLNSDMRLNKNIESILKLEEEAVKKRSSAELIAGKVTTFAGSSPFIILHALWFGVWIVINVSLIPGVRPFDPFPFSFLTLVVSLEAIFLTLLVLMSQNRMTKEADKRAHLDLQINMLAEQESTMTLKMLQKIGKHLGLEDEIDNAMDELSAETNVQQVAKTLEEKAPDL